MITAQPSEPARRLAVRYFRRRARKHLSGLYGAGLERLQPWNLKGKGGDRSPGPLIIVANHSSWWDAIMPILISLDHFSHDAYGVMVEQELSKYRFFRKVGIFSIDRGDPRSALRSLQYGADLLRDTDRVLWFFPQGEIVPNDHRPFEIESGISRLALMIGRVTVLPIAFRYELLDNEHPDCWFRCGEPLTYNGSENRSDLTTITTSINDRLEEVLNQLRTDVLTRYLREYEPILEGTRSINRGWDRLRGKT